MMNIFFLKRENIKIMNYDRERTGEPYGFLIYIQIFRVCVCVCVSNANNW